MLPTGRGFWVPWIARALAQCWPFCWCFVFVLDHFSCRVVGFSVFCKQPTGQQISEMLQRPAQRDADRQRAQIPRNPPHAAHREGPPGARSAAQRSEHGFGRGPPARSLGEHRRPYPSAPRGGQHQTLKTEAMRALMVPFSLAAMRAELVAFVRWYDAYRPHQSFGGRTPAEVYEGLERADQGAGGESVTPLTSGKQLALKVSYLDGRKHLPIVELRAAA